MNDLGSLIYFLSIEVSWSFDGYFYPRLKYASDLLSRVGLLDSKIADTSLELDVKLRLNGGEPLPDPILYRQLVGSLIYLTIMHQDISYAVHLVGQFMTAPSSTHFASI